MDYVLAKVKIPTFSELIDSLDDITLSQETKTEILDCYSREIANLFSYAASAKQPRITLNSFYKQGSQWIAGFAVEDLEKNFDPNSLNLHLQNISQMVYNGCILYDERDNGVSTHH